MKITPFDERFVRYLDMGVLSQSDLFHKWLYIHHCAFSQSGRDKAAGVLDDVNALLGGNDGHMSSEVRDA